MKKRISTLVLSILLILSLSGNLYFIINMHSTTNGRKFDKNLVGQWLDDSNEICIEEDGSFVWINWAASGDYIFHCEKGYIDTNSLVITQYYSAFFTNEEGFVSSKNYKSLEDIPLEEYKDKNTFYQITIYGETTFKLSKVDGSANYTFVKQ